MHDLVVLRRGTTSPLLSLPFGCWVLGGRRLVLGLLPLHLHPSKACPAPRAPTTSIAAHAGHQHSYSSACGRNVTFLSSVQMKKNVVTHDDESHHACGRIVTWRTNCGISTGFTRYARQSRAKKTPTPCLWQATPSFFTSKKIDCLGCLVRKYDYVNPAGCTSLFSLSRAIRALNKFQMCCVCHGGCVVRLLRIKRRDSPPGRAQTVGHDDPTFVTSAP